jgi:hypothetical protein
MYQVIVGNVGTVYHGDSELDAREKYDEYVMQSMHGRGRASGEDVTMLADDEIVRNFDGIFHEAE